MPVRKILTLLIYIYIYILFAFSVATITAFEHIDAELGGKIQKIKLQKGKWRIASRKALEARGGIWTEENEMENRLDEYAGLLQIQPVVCLLGIIGYFQISSKIPKSSRRLLRTCMIAVAVTSLWIIYRIGFMYFR